jgi:hypothetical protein
MAVARRADRGASRRSRLVLASAARGHDRPPPIRARRGLLQQVLGDPALGLVVLGALRAHRDERTDAAEVLRQRGQGQEGVRQARRREDEEGLHRGCDGWRLSRRSRRRSRCRARRRRARGARGREADQGEGQGEARRGPQRRGRLGYAEHRARGRAQPHPCGVRARGRRRADACGRQRGRRSRALERRAAEAHLRAAGWPRHARDRAAERQEGVGRGQGGVGQQARGAAGTLGVRAARWPRDHRTARGAYERCRAGRGQRGRGRVADRRAHLSARLAGGGRDGGGHRGVGRDVRAAARGHRHAAGARSLVRAAGQDVPLGRRAGVLDVAER